MQETRAAEFGQLLGRLKSNGVEFIIIGGVAASLHGSPVATYDLDICAPLNDANLAKIVAAIRDIRPRHRMRPDKLPLKDDPAHLRGIKNLYLATDLGTLDVLGELPGVGSFAEILDRTVEMKVGQSLCKVLDIDTLIAAKNVAGRDKDILNIRHLTAIKKTNSGQPGLFDPPPSSQ